MAQAPRLRFYYREGCHLCEEMWQQLQELPGSGSLAVERVDIGGQGSLESRYGRLIPVLTAGDEILCNYYLDPVSLRPFLETVV